MKQTHHYFRTTGCIPILDSFVKRVYTNYPVSSANVPPVIVVPPNKNPIQLRVE